MGSVNYQAIVIGASSGGLAALTMLLSDIPKNYPIPIIVVQHRFKEERDLLESVLQQKCNISIKQADEKEKIVQGFVYVAPPNYHLMIESDKTFSLSVDDFVKHSRPSIDVLFETASRVYARGLVGIILTGSNDDGANGIKSINRYRGLTIAQRPEEAKESTMPLASISTGAVKQILTLKEIAVLLNNIAR